MRLTHIIEGNLLYSETTDLIVNLIQKHSHGISRIKLNLISGHCDLNKFTHRINHHIDHCYGYIKIAVLDVCLQIRKIWSC